jgi:hypothetical protein
MQQPKPTNVTGVTVTIDAIDPNSNWIHIGDATSDANGNFAYAWTTPDVPGQYNIIATFKGSASYGSSSAGASTYVSEQPLTTATPASTMPSVADTYFIPAIAGLFALIIIVAIILVVLMLRKR